MQGQWRYEPGSGEAGATAEWILAHPGAGRMLGNQDAALV